MKPLWNSLLLLGCSAFLCATDSKDLKTLYKSKYLIVLCDASSEGVCVDEARAQRSGVFVKEVRGRMTLAEVEAALGPPSTKVDLGEKVLYKYKDMTVEFHDGKVTDVR